MHNELVLFKTEKTASWEQVVPALLTEKKKKNQSGLYIISQEITYYNL